MPLRHSALSAEGEKGGAEGGGVIPDEADASAGDRCASREGVDSGQREIHSLAFASSWRAQRSRALSLAAVSPPRMTKRRKSSSKRVRPSKPLCCWLPPDS